MGKTSIALIGCLVLLLGTAACGPESSAELADGSNSETTTQSAHESAPASPIAFGISVPHGSVQLGPLVRWRSRALLDSYQVDLDAILATEEAERLQKIEEQQAEDPSFTPPTPTPTPTPTRATKDTFAKLDEPPRADTYVSLMRITGKPTPVVRSMLAKLDVLLPEAGIVSDDLSQYCTARNRRVTGCSLSVEGKTPSGRTLDVHLTVDPGDIVERTSAIGSNERPVMVLYMRQTGDPREAQQHRDPERLSTPADVSKTAEKTGWIWPRMDESTPETDPVIDGWSAPASATVLLSGHQPDFATMATYRASITEEISQSFMSSQLGKTQPKTDVLTELNETIHSSFGVTTDQREVRAVQIASARGNFVSLFILPKGW